MRVESASKGVVTVEGILQREELSAAKDETLVSGATKGSEAAFGVLFQRYHQKMIYIANRILRNAEDAEDAVQLAFSHAFLHLKSFEGQAKFSTWLTRITINEALQLLRKRRPGHTSLESRTPDGSTTAWEVEDTGVTPEESINQKEIHGVLQQAIKELRPIMRKVVELYEIGELGSRKTAQALGLSNATVKARAFRARRLLRRKLDIRLRGGDGAGKEYLFAPTRSGRNYGHRIQTAAA